MAVIAVVVVPYAWHRLDDELRRHVEQLLARHYPLHEVRVESARLLPGEGIQVRGLTISLRDAAEPISELVRIDEMFLECSTHAAELVQGHVEIKQLVIRRPTLRVTRLADGGWSTAGLLPLPQFSKEPPAARIDDATIELRDLRRSATDALTLREADLELSVRPATASQGALLMVQGGMRGDHLRQATIQAVVDPTGATWSVAGSLVEVDLCHQLCGALGCETPAWMPDLGEIQAKANAGFRLNYEANAQPSLTFDVQGDVKGARVADPRLPEPLTNIEATFQATQDSFKLPRLTAQNGASTLIVSLERDGYTPESPMRLSLVGERLTLHDRLLDVLPAVCRREWERFRPAGVADVNVSLAYDGRAWQAGGVIMCHDVSFAYEKLPYRLENGRGKLELRDGWLSVDLTTDNSGAPATLRGKWQIVGEHPTGELDIQATGVRVDETLLAALSERTANVLRSMRVRGKFDLRQRVWRSDPNEPVHNEAELRLYDGAVQDERFPYPLAKIQGLVRCVDGVWTFENIQGVNDTGRVSWSGRLVNTPDGPDLALDFHVEGLPLEQELRDALSPSSQRAWDDLQPRGMLRGDIQVRQAPGNLKPSVWMRLEPEGESLSLDPARLTYRIEKLTGALVYQDGQFWLEQARGVHGKTTLTAHGHGQVATDGGWRLRLDQFIVDQLNTERDLLDAVDGKLRKMIGGLQPSGNVNVRGMIEVSSAPGGGLAHAEWNLDFDLHQNSVHCGVPLSNINGGLRLFGHYDGAAVRSRGELEIDSLTYNQLQVTDIRGPLWIDDSRLLLGFWADRFRQAQPERRLTYKLYGGNGVADGWVQFDSQPRYVLQASLVDGDLDRFARESLRGSQDLRGRILANVELRGQGTSLNELAGQGNIQLSDADIYQLPVMVEMLSVLNLRPPDKTAFDKADIEFRIGGQHVYIDKINFTGDAISLVGRGELDFHRQIRFTFHPVVGREDDSRFPLVRNLLGGAGQQVLLIHISGSLDQPLMRREAFPGVQQALQQLQAEFQPK